MTSTWLAAVVALVGIAMTYFICVRPHASGRQSGVASHSENQGVGRQLARLRDDLRALQAYDALDGSRAPGIDPPSLGQA